MGILTDALQARRDKLPTNKTKEKWEEKQEKVR